MDTGHESEASARLTGATTRKEQFDALGGPGHPWWRNCQGIVRASAERAEAGARLWELSRDEDRLRRLCAEQADSEDVSRLFTTAIHMTAEVTRLLAGQLAPSTGLLDVLRPAEQYWAHSGLLVSAPAEAGMLLPDKSLASVELPLRQRIRAIAQALSAQPAAPSRAMVLVTALRLAGVQLREKRVTRISVLFDRTDSSGGAAGRLEIRELPSGPAGLYPDPEAMSFTRGDHDFADSLASAWSYAIRGMSEGRCVLWRLTLNDEAAVPFIHGGSLGAAFAIALREHFRKQISPRRPWAPLRAAFLGPRPRCAVTGAIAPGDRLTAVGGMEAKMKAAAASNWRLVAPKDNQGTAVNAPDRLHVYWAGTLRQASRYARRWRPVGTGLAAAVALVLAGAGVAVRANTDAADGASLARALNASTHVAAESETFDATDPAMAALLAAAAWRIDPTPQARESLLKAYAQPERATLPESAFLAEGAQSIAFSPVGSMLAMTGNDSVELWNAATHQEMGSPIRLPNDDGVCAVSFSPGGKLVAIEDLFGAVRLWNAVTRRPVGPTMFAGYDMDCGLAFSPDGNMLAAAGPNGSIRMWNLRTYSQVGTPMPAASGIGLGDLVFNPAGTILVAAAKNGMITTWNVATHVQIGAPISDPQDRGTVAVSPDGKILATVGGDLRFWSVSTHREIGSPVPIGPEGAIGVAFSPTQPVVATANLDGTTKFWDETTHQEVGPVLPADSSGAAISVAFSHSGGILATTTQEETRVWNASLFSSVGSLTASTHGAATDVAFSPSGRMLATTGADGTAQLWNPATRRPIGAPLRAAGQGALSGVAFSPSGGTLALSGRDVQLWNVAARKPSSPPLPGLSPGDAQAIGPDVLSFSADGSALAFLSSIDNAATFTALRLWDTVTHRPIGKPIDDGGDVWAVAFSPDGTLLATGTDGQTSVLRSGKTYRQVGASLQMGTGANVTWSVAFSPNGKTVATTADDQVQLWDAATQQPDGAVITAGDSGTAAVTFSPNGELLATADGSVVRLWDVATQQQIGPDITPGSGAVNAIAFSPDGRLLAIADSDGTVQLIDVAFPAGLASAACAIAGHSLTPDQWSRFVPNEPYQKICLVTQLLRGATI